MKVRVREKVKVKKIEPIDCSLVYVHLLMRFDEVIYHSLLDSFFETAPYCWI